VREPDLVVWLQASPETLLARVRRRGIAMEHAIDTDYLGRLCDAYADHFRSYDGAPVFAVDTEHVNFVERDVDVAHLIERLDRFEGRRDTLGTSTSLQ
jgi:deoxyguanosine kinase